MNKIFKYQLEIIDVQIIKIPIYSHFLCVQVQRDIPCIWANVNPSAELCSMEIYMYGTGQPIERGGIYIGTFQIDDGNLDFHVFHENWGYKPIDYKLLYTVPKFF